MFGMGLRLTLEQKGPIVTTLRGAIYTPKGGTRVIVREIEYHRG